MANYRSLVGGYFSSTPSDLKIRRSIRANNPWALNVSDWQKTYPGYAGTTQADSSPNANKTTIYETPEHGIAAGWDLLRRYAVGGHDTVKEILTRYGGTNQDYSAYLNKVVEWSGLSANTSININDDEQLLKLAKAMFRYEAGVHPIPWSDAQILYGFQFARAHAKGMAPPAASAVQSKPAPQPVATAAPKPGLLATIFGALFKKKPAPVTLPPTTVLRLGDKGPHVEAIQKALTTAGFFQYKIDGDFGPITQKAVRNFQVAFNLDPDGEVGPMTLKELNAAAAAGPVKAKPVLPGPSAAVAIPPWYLLAEKDIGFREVGVNRGIEKFITAAKTGSLGDPWCAIGVNSALERSGVKGSRSAMARSFEHNADFVKLSAPALGAIVTMWRGSPTAGTGHVFLYDGTSAKGVRGIGYNEDDGVRRSFHEAARITGYWWPKSVALPKVGKIIVGDGGDIVTSET